MRVLVPSQFRDALAALPSGVEPVWFAGVDDAAAAASEVDVACLDLYSPGDVERVLRAGANIRWLHVLVAGVDQLPLAVIAKRNVVLTNGSGIHSIPIAEYTVMAMLTAAKGFADLVRANDRREWQKEAARPGELLDTDALIVGYGSIGREIGVRLEAFGVRVTGVRRSDGTDWRALLGGADWVILATPLTAETRRMIGASELERMRETAWLINISRGALVDQDALVAALQGGQLAGACLDATSPEPLPCDSELWGRPDVIITPHVSWASSRFTARSASLFLDNLTRYASNEPLRNIVDIDAGY